MWWWGQRLARCPNSHRVGEDTKKPCSYRHCVMTVTAVRTYVNRCGTFRPAVQLAFCNEANQWTHKKQFYSVMLSWWCCHGDVVMVVIRPCLTRAQYIHKIDGSYPMTSPNDCIIHMWQPSKHWTHIIQGHMLRHEHGQVCYRSSSPHTASLQLLT